MLIGLLMNGLAIFFFLSLKKFDTRKIKISIASLLSTILVALVPSFDYRFDKSLGEYYVGFPAEILVYYDGMFSFVSFGLLFNFFFFYWVYKIIVHLGEKIIRSLK